jgi:hypothetical protein
MVAALRIITAMLALAALSSLGHAMPLLYKRLYDPLLSTAPFRPWEWLLYLLPFALFISAGTSLVWLRRARRKAAANSGVAPHATTL